MKNEEEDFSAGLIGQAIPDVAETEPRLNSEAPEDYYDQPSEDATCERCWGDGCYHDCGEDTCCCAFPERDALVECEDCNGTGVVR